MGCFCSKKSKASTETIQPGPLANKEITPSQPAEVTIETTPPAVIPEEELSDIESKNNPAADAALLAANTPRSTEKKSSTISPNGSPTTPKETELTDNTAWKDSGNQEPVTIVTLPKSTPMPEKRVGKLKKQGQRSFLFTERVFVLENGVLSNYADYEASQKNDVIAARESKRVSLAGCTLECQPQSFRFVIKHSADGSDKGISPRSTYTLEINNATQYSLWEISLKEHLAYANSILDKTTASSRL